ncbi:hypothetical protein Rhe02_55130 [Rhizocola hellebori]|uniref:Uncharacterized protein n=2 Tax=Rhizocola hellebori TaxID=1392758 RepID=A0A8J3QDQ0_9ACTN|nr:hypothetical protein Rhe02_55130 [Rhizocola hellebori]
MAYAIAMPTHVAYTVGIPNPREAQMPTTRDEEIASRYVTQHALTLGRQKAVALGRAAARLHRETDGQRLQLLTRIYPAR